MLTILQGDALEKLRELPSESVQCCVTSPPYWGLRDYGTAQWEGGDDACDHANPKIGKPTWGPGSTESSTLSGRPNNDNHEREGFKGGECPRCGAKRIDSQLGLEKTPEEYVAKMVEVFREVRRVLRKDGTLWLNLGDSYAGSWGNYGGQNRGNGSQRGITSGSSAHQKSYDGLEDWKPPNATAPGLKPKDMCGIPWRVAFALQADGWWLRSDIIWAKPNPMPESVTDRPTKAHEYIFLLTKASSYYYDLESIREREKPENNGWMSAPKCSENRPLNGARDQNVKQYDRICGANRRSVWTIATQPYPEAHFATFPEEIPKLCILAGTSAKGCCPTCRTPWNRIVDTQRPATRETISAGPYGDHGQLGSKRWDEPIQTKTLGWQPACSCDVNLANPFPPIPCAVLDPFAGSGTTGMVALELGRKAVLIELNPKYVALIEQRCTVTPGLALA